MHNELHLNARKCTRHTQITVSHLCLRDKCGCDSFICSQCLRETHKNAPKCAILRTEPPLSLCNVNNRKISHFADFHNILGKISEIWESGSEMMQKQLEGLEGNFLLPINLMCKTFAEETPEQIQQSLLIKEVQPQADAQSVINVQILRLLAKNTDKLQHVQQIKKKSMSINERLCVMLLKSFQQLQTNLTKINNMIKEQSIFDIEMPVKPSQQAQNPSQDQNNKPPQSQKPLNKTDKLAQKSGQQTVLNAMIAQIKKQNSVISKNSEQKRQVTYILSKQTQNELQSKLKQHITALQIKSCNNTEILIDKFLNLDLSKVTDLTIDTPTMSNLTIIPLLLSIFTNLKSASFNCDNQFYKCYQDLSLYDHSGKQRTLDRIQYFYDFRRRLESLDENYYFKIEKIPHDSITRIHFFNYKQESFWSEGRRSIPPEGLATLVNIFKPKNLWLSTLDDSTIKAIEKNNIKFSSFQELTLGTHKNSSSHIPTQIQNYIKTASNLKSLVLISSKLSSIESVHLAMNLLEIFRSASQLQVLVLDEFICSGDNAQQQKLYDSLPKYCPKIIKLWISGLKLIDLSFIANLPALSTLILPKSYQLTFKSQKQLNITHLNLYNNNWNYISLLNSLNTNLVNYLNLGQNTISAAILQMVIGFLLKCKNLRCLCLDRMKFGNQINGILQNNRQSLEKLSLFNCKYHEPKLLLESLQKCTKLKVLDVNSCGAIEQEILKKIPSSLQALTVSKDNYIKMLAQGLKPSNSQCTIITIT